VRSIFERFSDLNAFSLATADYAIAQGQAEAVARSVDGDRPTRIQSHVETRARACEKRGPQWRIITNLDELVELRSRIAMVRLAGTERMKLMYGPELSRLPEPAREQLLVAVWRWLPSRPHLGVGRGTDQPYRPSATATRRAS
jgi:hypothetical protein